MMLPPAQCFPFCCWFSTKMLFFCSWVKIITVSASSELLLPHVATSSWGNAKRTFYGFLKGCFLLATLAMSDQHLSLWQRPPHKIADAPQELPVRRRFSVKHLSRIWPPGLEFDTLAVCDGVNPCEYNLGIAPSCSNRTLHQCTKWGP